MTHTGAVGLSGAAVEFTTAVESDADQGIGQMVRVTRPAAPLAAAMWDIPGGGLELVSHFSRAAREIDPSLADDPPRAAARSRRAPTARTSTTRASLPEGPFTLPARAWVALGTVPS